MRRFKLEDEERKFTLEGHKGRRLASELWDRVWEETNVHTPDTSVLDLEEGWKVHTGTTVYSMIKFVGEGLFGKVALWQDLHTKETVAAKILKNNYPERVENEVAILNAIYVGCDLTNMVKLNEWIYVKGHDVLVFEKLDISLEEFLCRQDWNPLRLSEIRVIATQLLVALDALKGLCVLHTDIKPDNVMLVSAEEQPFKVKLIDFGNALFASQASPGQTMQALQYRSPEVFLGLPITEAVDMWGLGCLLAFLYLSDHLFPTTSEYEVVKWMVEVLGMPEVHQLRSGLFTAKYFTVEETDPQRWRLLTPEEFGVFNNETVEGQLEKMPRLDTLAEGDRCFDGEGLEDRMILVDLLKGMLQMDGKQRITPQKALQHPFITGAQTGPEEMNFKSSFSDRGLLNLTQGEDAGEEQSTMDRSSRQVLDSVLPETCSSYGSSVPLNGIPLLFNSGWWMVEVKGLAKTPCSISEAADPLRPPTNLEPCCVSDPRSTSRNRDISSSQAEVDAARSTAGTEGPSTAPTDRPRKSRLRHLFCGCFRPRVEE